MSKPIRVDALARQELTASARRYDRERSGLGTAFLDAIDEVMGRVVRLGPDCRPAFGVPVELGVRRVRAKRFPFAVVFIELPRTIRVPSPHILGVGNPEGSRDDLTGQVAGVAVDSTTRTLVTPLLVIRRIVRVHGRREHNLDRCRVRTRRSHFVLAVDRGRAVHRALARLHGAPRLAP